MHETLSHYRIVEKLGAGAMGDVYLATDTKLDRTVALKILPPAFAHNPERLERFVREAKAASAIQHANVAHIYEIGEADGVHFIAMEHVKGQTLAARLSGKPLPTPEILDIGAQVADALDEAHGKGITHRDIKPGNLMQTDRGQIKMLDFGLAKMAADNDRDSDAPTEAKTEAGMVMGTVLYMSPEQAQGHDVDGRTDIFSLGVVLYELATGRLPFSGASTTETLAKIATSQPEAIARLNYDVPAELERVIRKCLEKDADARYQTAKELLVDLKKLKRDTESGAIAATTPTKHNRWPALAAMVFGLLAAAGAIYWFASPSERIDSIAVLPFENGSADPDAEYFSDGVTESIIISLSHLPDVKVISRTSAFRYKGQSIDPETVGRELEVDALVLGRVTQRGDELSISAELVRARDSGLIWGEQYQRSAADVFEIQQDMAREISSALRLRLTIEQEELLTKQHTENPEAYEAYLKGRFQWNRRTEDGLLRSVELFQEAIEHDPDYAAAFAGLADTYISFGYYFASPVENFPKAKIAAERALELDERLGEAHTALGYVKAMYEFDFAGGELEFQRAIELSPTYATAYAWYAEYLMPAGRHDEAIEHMQTAVELEPLSRIINATLGVMLAYAERHQEAELQFEKTLELDPSWAQVHQWRGQNFELQGLFSEAIQPYQTSVDSDLTEYALGSLGHAYAKSGRIEEARAVLEQLDELAKSRYVGPLQPAFVHAGLGDLDACFEWLEKAYEERSSDVLYLGLLPIARDIEHDPRFSDLMRRMGLEE